MTLTIRSFNLGTASLALHWGLLSLFSCASLPHYGLLQKEIHKDSILLKIVLDEKLPIDSYKQIAIRELERARQLFRHRELPLYEARFEFLNRRSPYEKFATLIFKNSPHVASVNVELAQGSERAADWQIFIY
jgi:hypothetical protein